MKILAAAFCAAMLAVVGYLAVFVMPEEARHRDANAQWARDRDAAFSAADARLKRSDEMLSIIRTNFPEDLQPQVALLGDARDNANPVVRRRVQIDIVRNIANARRPYLAHAGTAALREALKARRGTLAAMMANGSIQQCASMYTGADSPPLPNEDRLLDADEAEMKAVLVAEAQGATSPVEYGQYTAEDDMALRQVLLSMTTDIPNPTGPFVGRADDEICRLGILHYDARLLLPEGGTFERSAIRSMAK